MISVELQTGKMRNWQIVKEQIDLVLAQGKQIPSNKALEKLTPLDRTQIGTAKGYLRRMHLLDHPDSKETSRVISEGVIIAMGGKRYMYKGYADMGMSAVEIHHALYLDLNLDVDSGHIGNTVGKARKANPDLTEEERTERGGYRRLTEAERAIIRNTVPYATDEENRNRVRYWLPIRDFVFTNLVSGSFPFRRYHWIDMIGLCQQVGPANGNVSIDGEAITAYVASLERMIKPRHQFVAALDQVTRSLVTRLSISLEQALRLKEADRIIELREYIYNNFVEEDATRKTFKSVKDVIKRVDSMQISLVEKERLLRCLFWEEKGATSYGRFFGVPKESIWQSLKDLIDGDMDDLHAQYDRLLPPEPKAKN